MRVIEALQIGGYKIIQDTDLYRFTSDAVLLSRFQRAKKGERVADFCAGSGIVGLHFYAENAERVSSVTLFELQEELADMSRETVALNNLEDIFTVETGRVQDIPAKYTEYFSLILCNPPYERGGLESPDEKRAPCRKELFLTLPALAESAARCLKFGGRFSLVHRADRLAEVMYTLHEKGLEPKKMQLIAGKTGDAPYAVLLTAVKGGRAGLEVLPTRANDQRGF